MHNSGRYETVANYVYQLEKVFRVAFGSDKPGRIRVSINSQVTTFNPTEDNSDECDSSDPQIFQ